MSENKIGFALVHEICPICGKPMNEQILMNSVLSKKYAKEIEMFMVKLLDIVKLLVKIVQNIKMKL